MLSTAPQNIISECQRFYAAMRLYAEQTAGVAGVDKRFSDILTIMNFLNKKGTHTSDKDLYVQTADSIWDTMISTFGASRILQNQFDKLLTSGQS